MEGVWRSTTRLIVNDGGASAYPSTLEGVVAYKWNDRDVDLKDFTVREMRGMREAFASDHELGMWHCLSLSAYYADDGTRVFQSADEIINQPAKYSLRLTKMAQDAMEVNTVIDDDASPLS